VKIKWDASIRCADTHEPIMLIKNLFYIEERRLFGWVVIPQLVLDLHMMVRADYAFCYHTHPYWAYRLPIWGGYVEEIECGIYTTFWPFRLGYVHPTLAHRIECLLGRRSLSLWLRGKSTHPIEKHGVGWMSHDTIYQTESSK